MRHRAALPLSMVVGAGLAASCAEAGSRRAARPSPLGEPEVLAHVGVREPSGVAYHPRLDRLFVVGDEGRLACLDRKGSRLRTLSARPQVEDVLVLPEGSLLIVRESSSELFLVDPETGKEKKRWRLDTAGLVGVRSPFRTNEGFEGIAFRPDSNRSGSGVLYLVHQRSPAMIVAATFDPAADIGRLGAEAVVSRWRFDKEGDLTAATYVPSLDRILAIADARDRLLVLGRDGKVEASIPLPGMQQEGLTFDDEGALWVADDRAGHLLRFPGALARIAALLGAHSSELK